MGDPDHRGAGLARELLHLGKDLGLDRHIQRRRRFIGDDQVGLVQKGDGDRHPLAHAAGQLVRIGAQALFRRRDADMAKRVAARSRAVFRSIFSWAWIASIICVSIRRTGFSVIIGS